MKYAGYNLDLFQQKYLEALMSTVFPNRQVNDIIPFAKAQLTIKDCGSSIYYGYVSMNGRGVNNSVELNGVKFSVPDFPGQSVLALFDMTTAGDDLEAPAGVFDFVGFQINVEDETASTDSPEIPVSDEYTALLGIERMYHNLTTNKMDIYATLSDDPTAVAVLNAAGTVETVQVIEAETLGQFDVPAYFNKHVTIQALREHAPVLSTVLERDFDAVSDVKRFQIVSPFVFQNGVGNFKFNLLTKGDLNDEVVVKVSHNGHADFFTTTLGTDNLLDGQVHLVTFAAAFFNAALPFVIDVQHKYKGQTSDLVFSTSLMFGHESEVRT